MSKHYAFSRSMLALVALTLLVPTFAFGGGSAAAATLNAGTVYTLTNAVSGNAVAIFSRAVNGTLTAHGTVASGGLGTGAGLGSQGAVVLSNDKRWLFAVNAGSNSISVFAVSADSLQLVQTIASGGTLPTSLTVHEQLVYVLNAGGSGNITGFTQDEAGMLTALAGSTRPLSSTAAGAAEVAFNPAGTVLAVTEKATSTIDTYPVEDNGVAGGPIATASSGTTPFGFAWTRRGQLLVSEAGSGAASSYGVNEDGVVHVIAASVPTHQTAACWLVQTSDSRFAYTANAGSGSISGYAIGHNGSLTLLNADGRTGVTGDGSHPIDMAMSRGGRYLYVLTTGNGEIAGFAIRSDGSLVPAGSAGGLPAGTVGLAAR